MSYGDFASDREAQSRTTLGLARHAEKAIKDPALILFWNTRALVGDAELDAFIAAGGRAQSNRSSRR